MMLWRAISITLLQSKGIRGKGSHTSRNHFTEGRQHSALVNMATGMTNARTAKKYDCSSALPLWKIKFKVGSRNVGSVPSRYGPGQLTNNASSRRRSEGWWN